MILTREHFCIPFKDVLKLHKKDLDVRCVYDILLVNKQTGSVELTQLSYMTSRGCAMSFAKGYFYENYDVIDAWCIYEKKNHVPSLFDTND